MSTVSAPPTLQNRNRRVGLIALALALAMVGLGFASVPLYRIFCQVTGYGGTTQRASAAEAAAIKVSGKTIIVRFDGNVDRGMAWEFRPDQVSQTVSIGARSLARFSAKNLSDRAITGRASFNVEPEQAGLYFHKIQCFCFTEQTLRPGEQVDMPVIYYVDPKILTDPDTRDIGAITLSYTFHKTAQSGAKALDRARTGG
jgi:cytochrome c oxidase assembly protein subunit 11